MTGEYEAYDPVYNSWVGSLQLHISNEGTYVSTQNIKPAPEVKTPKKDEDAIKLAEVAVLST
jgi:hypothetical protein